MKMSVRKITMTAIAYLMIGFVGLTITNKVVYTHAHKIDGKVVVHAHPFNKSQDTNPYKAHHHGDIQIAIIDNLDLLFPLLFFFFTAKNCIKKIERCKPGYLQFTSFFFPGFSERAPPYSLVSFN
jgi:hypothetical protein